MGISAKELRIGNLVSINNKKHRPRESGMWCKVSSVSETTEGWCIGCDLEEDGQKFGQFIRYVKPIELTEEWLIKFGFEKKGVYRRVNDGFIFAVGRDGSFGLYNNEYGYSTGNSFRNGRNIEYVHQLQNLYFALTSEELKTK